MLVDRGRPAVGKSVDIFRCSPPLSDVDRSVWRFSLFSIAHKCSCPPLTSSATPEPTFTLATAPTPNPDPMGTPMPGNNRGDALAIGFGEAASFSITSPGSHYFEVQLEEGTTYSIDVSLGTLEYSVLALKNIEGATLKYVVVTGDRDVGRIVWTATGSGSYFVEMYGPRGPGSYSLTVTDVESTRSTPTTPQPTTTPGQTATPLPSAPHLTFASVSAGGNHTCGVTTSGAAYCWGGDSFGQLGNGSTDNQTMPVAVSRGLTFESVSAGSENTCGVTTSGVAYCWGVDSSGRLGDDSATTNQATPVAVGPSA